MGNLSNFIGSGGSGGGGGGLLNQTKYSTARALGDTDRKLLATFTAQGLNAQPIGTTEMVINTFIPADFADGLLEDVLVGTTFVSGTETSTILSSTATTGTGGAAAITITFAARTETISILIPFTPPTTFVVNPATDLSLSDGDLLGYFMVGGGGGAAAVDQGGIGGKILQGTIIVPTAATDLVLTSGVGGAAGTARNGSASTVSGGLTLTTVDGYDGAGWGSLLDRSTRFAVTGGPGINGYGMGGAHFNNFFGGIPGNQYHGFGGGAPGSISVIAGDGAIIFFY